MKCEGNRGGETRERERRRERRMRVKVKVRRKGMKGKVMNSKSAKVKR